MRMVHWRKPLALGSPSSAFALTSATLSRSQADLVLFLTTKRVREPNSIRILNHNRSRISVVEMQKQRILGSI